MIRVWQLATPANLYEEMKGFLLADSRSENGCFLVVYSHARQTDGILTVNSVILPTEGAWFRRTGDSLEPSSSFLNHAAVEADLKGAGLVFVHTHPSDLHPVGFSPIDDKTNRRLLPNLAEILPNRPLGSLVIGPRGFAGVVLNRGKMYPLQSIRACGVLMRTFDATKFNVRSLDAPDADTSFDRQRRALGTSVHQRLRDITATIVGVGGTGSSVAVQLARMGVKRLRLVDPDVLDETNLPRVYGSTAADIGKPKVELVKRHITSFSKTEVEPIEARVGVDDVLSELLDSDVIFGCTDNLTSRAFLNDLSIQYYVPLIDVGCRIRVDPDESIAHAIAKIQVLTPDTACLWCTGTLDGRAILQEALPAIEKQKLETEGYYQSIERQPSVIFLTTLAASLGVSKLLSLLGAFGQDYPSRTQIELRDGIMNNDLPQIKDDCVCRKRQGLGDTRQIAFSGSPNGASGKGKVPSRAGPA